MKRITFIVLGLIALVLFVYMAKFIYSLFPDEDILEEIRIAQKKNIDEQGFVYVKTDICYYYNETEIDCPWEIYRPYKVDSTFVENNNYYVVIHNKFGKSQKMTFDKIQIHNKRLLINNNLSKVNAIKLRTLHMETSFRDSINYPYVKISKHKILLLDDFGNQVQEHDSVLIK